MFESELSIAATSCQKRVLERYTFNMLKIALQSLLLICLLIAGSNALAVDTIPVQGDENGKRMTEKYLLWYDASSQVNVDEVAKKTKEGLFIPLNSMGSTGLKPGAIWSWFKLKNVQDYPITLHIEYVDHQLIGLEAFEMHAENEGFNLLANLGLDRPFSERSLPHHRFIFEVTLLPKETHEFLVKFKSDGMGFVFPDMRIWTPYNLRESQTVETSGFAFLIGGFFLMSMFAFAGGIASKEKIFFAYSVYALSKIAVWATVMGFTHQFVLPDKFHWSYMSMSGATSILCGLFFARLFLQTAKYTPRLDAILLFMMGNALFLLTSAIFKLTTLSVISITLALLLYPVVSIAALVRWYQGSKEAAVFAAAWTFLVAGLFVQALRDLGFVEHNFFYYYWPPFASFTEMVVILFAMGMKINRLHKQKDEAELKYTMQLERSKNELEELVLDRTRDLLKAKSKAEVEARTDSLTGTRNRRSFFDESSRLLAESRKRSHSFSLLMFDIDNFKSINDTYGHKIGDDALKLFAKTIQAKIRESDIFGRLGGEEFSLLVCDTPENTQLLAERLREEVARLHIETPLGPVKFTTSIGIAHVEKGMVIDELLTLADRALYQAKRNGRNRVVVSTEEADETELG
ncbi:sensor domain-containing diguanylate cyclase [Aestuariibacter sp. AA17]|uniref:diguanylate cyclase n=1 Tax=Fluctibacter corallii TaxID=2984329 RepID=A0ABT3A5V9_9ALTE|nr:diguanylate cyclase [Aestuariibacter sp. AA17]MCV2883993.1 sensor domain-containing diguanylate cyclase [Aestuariibacter sp. AA17]